MEGPLARRAAAETAASAPVTAGPLADVRAGVSARDYDRLLAELAQANRRLTGILEIVLSTIDSGDVGVLFSRVMEQINQTMAASGTLLYLLEDDRLHLRGRSEGVDVARVPTRLSPERLRLTRQLPSEEALRLRVLPPSRDDLRRGGLLEREVRVEATGETLRLPTSDLPPFASMLVTPVWFGGHLIAALVTGWTHARSLSEDDARLLGAVGRYLSTQLAGALSTLRQQRSLELAEAGTRVRELLLAGDAADATELRARALALVADALGCEVALRPSGLGEGEARQGEGEARQGEAGPGGAEGFALAVGIGALDGEPTELAATRDASADPFDDLEVGFLRSVGEDLRDGLRAGARASQDRRISQALQTGMRNELQRVEGLTAQGIYSSATQQAFVGGDFYDLVRLPKSRACVIMGDVSGKGVEAASVSAAVKTALAAYSWEGLRPARMVALLNDFLLGFSRLETFATLFVGIVDVASGRLTYCSAGHPPAIVARAATGELATCDVQSGVVGAFAEMAYRDGDVELAPGDVLMLYTDGTTEARARDGAFYGEEGLREALVAELPGGFEGLLDRLLARLDDFTGRRLEDDVAMVALRYDGLPS